VLTPNNSKTDGARERAAQGGTHCAHPDILAAGHAVAVALVDALLAAVAVVAGIHNIPGSFEGQISLQREKSSSDDFIK